MNKYIIILLNLMLPLFFYNCSDNILDVESTTKISGPQLYQTEEGLKAILANIYYELPLEDFTYGPFREQFFGDSPFHTNTGLGYDYGGLGIIYSDEGLLSTFNVDPFPGSYFAEGYALVRDINLLERDIPAIELEGNPQSALEGEVAFFKAVTYFAIAKRYGGVPIIDEYLEYSGDIESLKIPRSTEEETWDYIMEQCDVAIEKLPDSWNDGSKRATKFVAMAFKSRFALFAASVAKYWNEAPLAGDAVNQKLVGGFSADAAQKYYTACIDASEELINSGVYGLYMPNPADATEAAQNYQHLFEFAGDASIENIWTIKYGIGGSQGHNWDCWTVPNQTKGSTQFPGFLNASLDLCDIYESYDNPGQPGIFKTRVDGNEDDFNGFNANTNYIHYADPTEIFANKDARFHASIISPSSIFQNTEIIIQGGFVKPDGTATLITDASYTKDGVTYYTFGAKNEAEYSGFSTYGGHHTRSGFLVKKWLQEKNPPANAHWYWSTQDWVEMRYAEVLLNFAEAVVESGASAKEAAAHTALNDIRRRAGFMVDESLTLENVLRERKVELAFENKRYWDMVRRREYHKEWNNRIFEALMPVLDLREDTPSYIFIRTRPLGAPPRTFLPKQYYLSIPAITNNGLVQNPEY